MSLSASDREQNVHFYASRARAIGSPRTSQFQAISFAKDGSKCMNGAHMMHAGVITPMLGKARSYQPCVGRDHGFLSNGRFALVHREIDQQIEKVKQSKRITVDDVCSGHQLFEQVKCKQCGCLPKGDPVECQNCETIFCEICCEQNALKKQEKNLANQCSVCKKSFKKKQMNRKVKEIMLSELRFKCSCQSSKKKLNAPDQLDQLGGDLSDTTIATESILNDVLKVNQLTKNSKPFYAYSPSSPRHKFQKVDVQDRRVPCDFFQEPVDTPLFQSQNIADELTDSSRLSPDNNLKKRDLKYLDKKQSQSQAISTVVDLGNQSEPIEYTHTEFVNHVENECPLRKQYSCPNSRCTRDYFHSIEQLKYHLLNECIHSIFECQTCLERAPYHKLKSQHTKDHCLVNLKRENQQIKQEMHQMQKHIKYMQESSKKKKIPQELLIQALLHYNRSSNRSSSSDSSE